ncbi:MAG: leucyl aminopeptidase [Deltaproteobacteria bacterium]|nr:leucyl aminopeptidase [Deltaproteobacteria bacterium]
MQIEAIEKRDGVQTDLLAVGLWKDWDKKGVLSLTSLLDAETNHWATLCLKGQKFEGKGGESKLLHLNAKQPTRNLLVAGLGALKESKSNALRGFGALTSRSGTKIHAKTVAIDVDSISASRCKNRYQLLTEGLLLGDYSFDLYKSKENQTPRTVDQALLISRRKIPSAALKEVGLGKTLAEATNYARDLINIPATDMTPGRMVQEAKKVGKIHGVSCRILDRKACERLGMGGFLAVASGSLQPPYLIHLIYRPSGKPRGRVALVGKGITFDSGGLSLKPAGNMETMKDDMSGSAAVVALIKALATLRPPVEVHGIAAMTENMPSGSADKPGDIARTMNGKTIEILNTDAEGRLTLADALPYALKQNPEVVIDLATLTGACVVALGDLCAGIMGTDQRLVNDLIASGEEAGEKLWQLPLIEEYKEDIKSSVADVKNIGAKGAAGTITAGLFLREFVDSATPWAHIDIAGPAWTEKPLPLCPRGGTGFMVRTLFHYLSNYRRSR